GRYQAGFFPIMMFGLPAAALAMYHTAKTKRKKQAASLLLAAAFASFFTGVTEPLEFSFMFLAPVLYLVHAVLTGISLFVAATFQWTAGFGFSAGLVDFVLSSRLPLANQPYMLLVQGLVFGAIYYAIFRFMIVKLNLATPGRESDEAVDAVATETAPEGETKTAPVAAGGQYSAMAAMIYDGLGGDQNVTGIESCVTRLRVDVKDMDTVDQTQIKKAGIPGIKVVSPNHIQVIVGTNVQFVLEEIEKLRGHRAG
ncbi:PTS transporter subunit EIIC, partial [Exiguobacterium himgiriensis]